MIWPRMDLNSQGYFGFELDFLFPLTRESGIRLVSWDLPGSGPCFSGKTWPDLCPVERSSTPLAPEFRELDALGPAGRIAGWTLVGKWDHKEVLFGEAGA